MTVRSRSRIAAGVAGALLLTGAAGCGQASRTGRSPVYVVVQGISAASGADPTRFQPQLFSDVQTLVKRTVNGSQEDVATVFSDSGEASFQLSMKDVGQQGNPTAPSPNNAVTLTRYHVEFRRSDGRNVPGVDVPYPFDGAATVTITGNAASTLGFELVRLQAKKEAPLIQLVGGGGAISISTMADVTFYGKDVAGNDVTATGSITVDFADWADPSQ